MADSPGRRELLQDLLRGAGIAFEAVADWHAFLKSSARVALTTAPDVGGLSCANPALLLLADGEMFGRHAQQERRRRRAQLDPAAILRDLQDLAPGAPVVHEEYGVGRYVGLQAMQIADQDSEFLVIEYAGGDRIYVPVATLHLVSRYTERRPIPHRCTSWAPISGQGRSVAPASRCATWPQICWISTRNGRRARQPASPPTTGLSLLCRCLPLRGTADQRDAIDSVIKDMASERPMDRVVCGDVGFGKTEVALRAAFAAVQAADGRWPCWCPTTLLAQQQHTAKFFRDRFADLAGYAWRSLSRFRSAAGSREHPETGA